MKNKDRLSYKRIKKYNLPEREYKPDWDDTSVAFTLPNGLILSGMTQCNNSPCKMTELESDNGWIYIQSKAELEKLIKMDWEGLIEYVSDNNEDFDADNDAEF